MVETSNWICWIPVFPLIAFAVNILFGRKTGRNAALIAVGASALSCLVAWPLIFQVAAGKTFQGDFLWLALGTKASLRFGYLLDPLAATLLFVVTLIGTLIQIYSIGYMHGDPRFSRFFAYLSLFMAAMLTLVIANNFILFFMAWEVMGLCSYLLIGFWFEKDSAANASKKAFLTTRIGDVGLFLGILTVFVIFGTLDFAELSRMAAHHPPHALLPLAAFLIFCGTIGKSAQFPLHVWLPDAMEGPTPVSALIHAATMVAAGVYLIIRTFPILEAAPHVLEVISYIGAFTAFIAAFFALTANDIKKVLAYSTISQLGYMVAAVGFGGPDAGMFHLTTHAFFKALLFMGAGSVIHGTGTQDLRELGGLFGKMKSTAWTFLIASVAIAGIPPLSGFWSKDEILAAAAHYEGHNFLYGLLLVTAFMTAFYMFRLFFLTFLGKPRNEKIHAHESPAVMTVPLWILAAGSILTGLPGSPWMEHWFQIFLAGPHFVPHKPDMSIIVTSVAIGLAGVLLAALFYLWAKALPGKLAKAVGPLYRLSVSKLWFDEIYSAVFVKPFHDLGRRLFRFDQRVIDGAVNGTGTSTRVLSAFQFLFDKYAVDGLVNLTGYATALASAIVRRIQTGFIQNYLLIVFTVFLVLLYYGIR